MNVSPTARHRRMVSAVMAAALVAVGLVALSPQRAEAATLPSGFTESAAISGLSNPTVFRFAVDGRIFVGEKSGLIKVFDNLSDTTPTIFADLRTKVHAFWDRGLLGIELSPQFPTDPSVYVLYTHDAAIGGTAPRWGTAGASSDGCPTPPGATGDGCVVSGRLSRLQAAGNVSTGTETVLVEDWCQQYPSHSVGDLAFGPDGALYASAGDGASFNFVDYGQDGNPLNPCGDPPAGVGGAQTSPSAEGGSLRSQDLRTSGDPVGLSGTVIRVNPATGAGLPDNPLANSSDPNARRIVAHGFRNPFRFTMRPGTNELWVGDVGESQWEEIDRIPNPTDGTVDNFGWPCYEGTPRKSSWDSANLTICENLYAAGSSAVSSPYFSYHHNDQVVPSEVCPTGSSSIAGVSFAFAEGGNYPADYRGGLYFADYSRDCIWHVPKGANGLPDMSKRRTFVAGASNPVDLQVGPGGDLFYADHLGGAIRRISYTAGNTSPTAVATATPTSGPAPLTVGFDGSGSSDPDAGDTLTYAWDLDGDGQYDDSTAVTPTFTYSTAGTYMAALTVTDSHGAFDTDTVTISAGNTAPSVSIDSPAASLQWKVGDQISFSGSASDPQDGSLPASALSWSLRMQHCPSNCHTHVLQDFPGVAAGSFVAPDHEYPSYLELQLTARDSGGLTSSQTMRLDPLTTTLDMRSDPSGLQLDAAGVTGTTPFSRAVIVGSKSTINAPTPQILAGNGYEFASWSDSGAQSHDVIAGSTSNTYTATYRPAASTALTFSPAADARVLESSPTTNYGASTTLRADGGADPDVESYLRFTVTGVSGPVTNVKLRLHTTSSADSASGNGPAVYGTATGWTETGITWSNRPARTTAALEDKGGIAANTWLEYNVTGAGITGNGTYAFVVATSSADGTDLYSREAASFRPELIVTTGSV
jgi:glucose/arabinose dehydrogenase/PKD repeat protein